MRELSLWLTASFPIPKSCDASSPAKGEVSSSEAAALAAEDEFGGVGGGATEDGVELSDNAVALALLLLQVLDESTPAAAEADAGGAGGFGSSALGPAEVDMANFLRYSKLYTGS